MEEKNKPKIHPLQIKEANLVLTNLVIDVCILYYIGSSMESSNFAYWIKVITTFCTVLGIVFGILICCGWLVAIVTKNVFVIESKPQQQKDPKNGNDNLKLP